MRILFDQDGKHTYALQKDNPGWSLWKWNEGGEVLKGKYKGRVMAPRWVPMNRYPHTIEHAVNIISEEEMTTRVGDFALRTVLKDMKDWYDSLHVYAEGVSELVKNGCDDSE